MSHVPSLRLVVCVAGFVAILLSLPSSAQAPLASIPVKPSVPVPTALEVAPDVFQSELQKVAKLTADKYEFVKKPVKGAEWADKLLKAAEFADAVREAQEGERPSVTPGLGVGRLVGPPRKLNAAHTSSPAHTGEGTKTAARLSAETTDPSQIAEMTGELTALRDRQATLERDLATLADRLDQAKKFDKLIFE